MRWARIVSLALPTLFAAGEAGAQLFIGLGDLPGGATQSRAFGVSANGRVVVGTSGSDVSDQEPFRWTAAGMQGLGLLPGASFATCNGVSADGSTVVGGMTQGSPQAYRWTTAGGLEALGALGPGASSEAEAASADGSVIVGWSIALARNAFRWTESGGMQPLADPNFLAGGTDSAAQGVSADGRVVVGHGSSNNGAYEALRWTAVDGIQGLGDLADGAFQSSANAVSGDGNVAVGYGSSGFGGNAVRWTAADGMMTSLSNAPATAFAASADGSVVVGAGSFGLGPTDEAFVWDATNGMRRLATVLANDLHLDLTGWAVGPATGVSADGNTIVGFGTDPAGQVEAWLARLPEPDAGASHAAAAAALLALAMRARLRRAGDRRATKSEGAGTARSESRCSPPEA